MFHKKCFTEQGQAVRRSWSVHKCFTGIVSRLLFRFVRFRYTVRPFCVVLRFACAVLLVQSILTPFLGAWWRFSCFADKILDRQKVERLRACFGACLVLVSVRASVRPSWQGCARPYFLKSTIPPILPYLSPNKNFLPFKG